jgi:hypothetical protein
MAMIELHFITGETPAVSFDEPDGEDDALDAAVPSEVSTPTMVNVSDIRNFHARKYGKPGTRVIFRTGAAIPVTETYEEVKSLIQASAA